MIQIAYRVSERAKDARISQKKDVVRTFVLTVNCVGQTLNF